MPDLGTRSFGYKQCNAGSGCSDAASPLAAAEVSVLDDNKTQTSCKPRDGIIVVAYHQRHKADSHYLWRCWVMYQAMISKIGIPWSSASRFRPGISS